MTSPYDSRQNNLDAVRLALAVLVIFSHSFPLTRGFDETEPMMRATGGQTTAGTVAVDLFFVISGFLIANSFLNSRSVLSFLDKRVRRIYPGFIAAMVLCALVVAPLAGAAMTSAHFWSPLVDFLQRTVRLLEFQYTYAFHNNPYKNSINGAAWTIPYEFLCYAGVAILGVAGVLRRRGLVLLLLGVSLLFCLLYLVNNWKVEAPFRGHLQKWAYLTPSYLAGVTFYLWRDAIPHSGKLALVCVAVLAACCFVPNSWAECFPLAGAYLVFWFAFHPRIALQNFGKFGDFSYGTYLYAFPIQQLIVQASGASLGPMGLFVLAAPATLLAGAVSWWGVEHWFLPGKKRQTMAVQAHARRLSGVI